MRIAIISDSHDHIPNLQRAVKRANQEHAELLIHCGDLISPFMLDHLRAFQGPVHLIYGNNAGDQHLIATRCTAMANILHHGFHGTLTAGPLRIALQHYPEPAHDLARSGAFDLVCCGHDHIYAVEQINECLLINPGDLLGKDAEPAFALLETSNFSVRRIVVGDKLILND
ncbi:YfcE family phosphodiesterase [Desulfobulbus alkaliphilus]|uniref:YfcE family phosphodiesterase n=1 Tax=Desulfobulbus alkaliphilus TaxID=869814 RepID=UPI0019636A87|nr:YfcE family phosphodiesterase [Desulfobulbus alkaliphilus]MBM9537353.1 YfcE family phosphodiesterase [Desulfobulbus alkaliphilus]